MSRIDPEQAFRKAIHDLAEEPTPSNVRRYLVASALLERVLELRGQAKQPAKAA
jgi:hypothetical protein